MTRLEYINMVRRLEDRMYRLAKQMLISADEASDAVQETFAKLWGKKEQMNHIENKDAYIMRSLRNYCLDRIKSKQADESRLNDHEFHVSGISYEARYETTEKVSIVMQLINSLPEKQRSIILLRDIEGYEFKEMAELLDMNENAIRTALSRTRKILRTELLKQYEYGLQRNQQYS